VIPLGPTHGDQVLTVYERRADGLHVDRVLRCRFVPLVGALQQKAATPAEPGDEPGGEGPHPPRWDEVGP
jgi:hypothetical protein